MSVFWHLRVKGLNSYKIRTYVSHISENCSLFPLFNFKYADLPIYIPLEILKIKDLKLQKSKQTRCEIIFN